ncbi:hypothetical protein LWI29_010020 [Acer saccharum]|uniref:Retrovirus-related Pol polyprotein from transposon TNT 1-94-like beta-barrel domain-containing protein n=1 Tax=Acer saccharum TaxID=4024 RepID=A0AA39TN39_ACESA|nr:hypothetical protein LWI29_010020 [Acer saccharum]
MAFIAKSDNAQNNTDQSRGFKGQKKERPYCTHCKFLGHTIDRCYKLHGYPPGYKPRQKNNQGNQGFSSQTQAVANQVTDHTSSGWKGSVNNFVQMLNANQYQQLMSMLSNHLTTSTKASSITENPSTSYATGICFSVSLNPILSSPEIWIVYSGATSNICSYAPSFTTLHPIQNAFVTLSNHARIQVFFAGTVKLNDDLVLRDVLFLPQFKFNLLSVSALAKDSSLTVSFFSDCCLVQDHSNKRMIGKGKRLEDLYVLDNLVLPLSASDVPRSAHVPILHDQIISQEFDTQISSIPDQSTLPQNLHMPDEISLDSSPVLHNTRKSTRVHKPPSFLREYHCHLLSHQSLPTCTTPYPLS